jgi:hypothetical protein
VQKIVAEYGRERPAGAGVVSPGPVGIIQVDALWAAQVCKLRGGAPGGDAGQMRFKNVARPPGQLRRAAGEFGDVLAGAAADLKHVARLRTHELAYRLPNGVVVAVKGRAVEPAIRVRQLADISEFNNKSRHGCTRTYSAFCN